MTGGPRYLRWLGLVALLAGFSAAHGADYPTKPIKIITQAGAGSGPDVIGRVVADQLGRRLGQQVIIVNHVGAGGLIAAQAAASAEPDGYTLYMPSGSALTILPETHPNLSFSFDRDFVPIGMIAQTPMLIAAAANLGVSSLPELIALSKKQPGKLFYAGNTPGTVPSLTGELLKQRTGVDITFVPYPGAAAALKDVAGGRIAVIFESAAALRGAIDAGTLKVLAVGSEQRMSQFPGVPAAAELIPGLRATGWFALLARSGTPDEVIQTVSRALGATLADADLRAKLAKLGAEPMPMPPRELQAFVEAEKKNWIPLLNQAAAKGH